MLGDPSTLTIVPLGTLVGKGKDGEVVAVAVASRGLGVVPAIASETGAVVSDTNSARLMAEESFFFHMTIVCNCN
jgi:hypothetical protein